jgi:hypothetical protein
LVSIFDRYVKFPALRLAANVVEEFLMNAGLVAIDIQRVLLADESKSGTELGQGLGNPQDHGLSMACS